VLATEGDIGGIHVDLDGHAHGTEHGERLRQRSLEIVIAGVQLATHDRLRRALDEGHEFAHQRSVGGAEGRCEGLEERRQLADDAFGPRATCSDALAVLGSVSVPVEVYLNPADHALCREHGLELPATATLRKDGALRRGGLRLQAGHRIVDASIERRLDEVLASLRDAAGVPDPAAGPAPVPPVTTTTVPTDTGDDPH
jgi:hypothetical protein